MSCSGGICAPTDKKAVLNVGDLEGFLASGNVTVTTTGSGVQADDIEVKALLTWSTSNRLVLDAYQSIIVDKPVSVVELSGLTLTTDDGGANGILSFGPKGNVTFANLSSQLTINGSPYTLVGDIKSLASDIANNPIGDFALARNYNAKGDGTYASSPVPTPFNGTFEGLGNTISNLSVSGPSQDSDGYLVEGLCGELANGTLSDIGLVNATISCPVRFVGVGALTGEIYDQAGTVRSSYTTGVVSGTGRTSTALSIGGLVGSSGGGCCGRTGGTIANSYSTAAVTGRVSSVGGLVGLSAGSIIGSYATGSILAERHSYGGGLVGYNGGTISDSHATGNVKLKGPRGQGGGLVGVNSDNQNSIFGTIENSYATGSVSGGSESIIGGLVGFSNGTISNSYATGPALGGDDSDIGGLLGWNEAVVYDARINYSYSTGSVSAGTGSLLGGLIGDDDSPAGSLDDTYWDTDTSGITNLSQGAGNIANDPGITGLTTAQLQSGLPPGFHRNVWAENSKINGGLPYLRMNPPPK
jgi:hypothetical protein